jgi:glycosyltransferase involved in cell wall biosynthesis
MIKPKLIRVTTMPISMDKLLEGQLGFMSNYLDIVAVSSDAVYLDQIARREVVRSHSIEMSRTISPFKDIRAAYLMYRFLKNEKPQMIHSHTPKAGIVSMLASKLAGVPHRLHTVAGLPLMEVTGVKRIILNAVEKLTYNCATHIFPNSKGLEEFIIDNNFTKKYKLSIIGNGSSNGINTEKFNPDLFNEQQSLALKKELSINSNSFIYIFIGRIVADKGVHELISAFECVIKKHSKATLLLVGAFEEELDPINSNTLNSISNHPSIIHVGFQKDVRPYLALSQVLVFPSYREGFPNVVMQAGAMGLPSIVSDINGCNEIIESNKNGLIVPVKSAKALVSAMIELAQNKNKHEQLSLNARPMIINRYDRNVLWKALLNKYQELIPSLKNESHV